jgi:hypothetical protein
MLQTRSGHSPRNYIGLAAGTNWGRMRLRDRWGLAGWARCFGAGYTARQGTILGRFQYMSPEVEGKERDGSRGALGRRL